mgnify:CR=1 FL=1
MDGGPLAEVHGRVGVMDKLGGKPAATPHASCCACTHALHVPFAMCRQWLVNAIVTPENEILSSAGLDAVVSAGQSMDAAESSNVAGSLWEGCRIPCVLGTSRVHVIMTFTAVYV